VSVEAVTAAKLAVVVLILAVCVNDFLRYSFCVILVLNDNRAARSVAKSLASFATALLAISSIAVLEFILREPVSARLPVNSCLSSRVFPNSVEPLLCI
jgi:uncharacterized membrane protein